MTAIVTPFDAAGRLDEAAFATVVERQIADGVTGVIVGGCTGEFWAQSLEERKRLHALCVATVAEGLELRAEFPLARILVMGPTSSSREVAEARANLRAADARAWTTEPEVVWRGGMPYQTEVRKKVETEELVQARQVLDDLEEEFRQTGLPAGWSRD
jgi:dihydrodipicolinate synthase/N-acetylneuraminate lyase